METVSYRSVLVVTKARVREAEDLGATIARWLRARHYCQEVNVIPSEQGSSLYDDAELESLALRIRDTADVLLKE